MKRLLLYIFAAVLAVLQALAQDVKLQEGDLLFAYSPSHATAITQATVHDASQPQYYHVAIACQVSGKWYALEAIDYGVVLTPMTTFVERCKTSGGVKHARLKDTGTAKQCVENAMEYIGLPYDDIFMLDTQEIYCSELVQISYVDARGNRIFPLIHMSFHGSDGKILDYWREHYRKRGMAVPEGALGTNPAQIAAHPALTILGDL